MHGVGGAGATHLGLVEVLDPHAVDGGAKAARAVSLESRQEEEVQRLASIRPSQTR